MSECSGRLALALVITAALTSARAGGTCDAMCTGSTNACTLCDRGHVDMCDTCRDLCHLATCSSGQTGSPEQSAESGAAWDYSARQTEGRLSLKDWYFNSAKRRDVMKWHQYFRLYERHLRKFHRPSPPPRIIEIGTYKGGSLDMWQYWFQGNVEIWAVDIDPYETASAPTLNHHRVQLHSMQPSYF